MLFAIQQPTLPIARQLAIYILWFHIGLYIVVAPILILVNLVTLFVPPWYVFRRKKCRSTLERPRTKTIPPQVLHYDFMLGSCCIFSCTCDTCHHNNYKIYYRRRKSKTRRGQRQMGGDMEETQIKQSRTKG